MVLNCYISILSPKWKEKAYKNKLILIILNNFVMPDYEEHHNEVQDQ